MRDASSKWCDLLFRKEDKPMKDWIEIILGAAGAVALIYLLLTILWRIMVADAISEDD